MRQIILDTETTGLEPTQGHRIIEIGCVELVNRRKTGNVYHQYINPEREIEDGAYDVHGISNEILADKPVFADIAREFIDFIRDSELIIHNAPFDVGFINAELSSLGKEWGQLGDYCRILDTLVLAREKHPGQKNSLDALCKRYEVDNSQRELHGALLDAQILVDVYLLLTGGQTRLTLEHEPSEQLPDSQPGQIASSGQRKLKITEPSAGDMELHRRRLAGIEQITGKPCLWHELEK
ncbi:MAG: DNA polymerase III subunit epsilon [Gammaproteobacteria bacterium]|nr:DNA polymerase III subunit epsilon [Gammaproteobacteria bacterium]